MKKLLLLFAAVILSISLKAQNDRAQAPDFTATDIHGQQIHLYEILDRGQYVLIDFFFTNCGPCKRLVPNLVESYYSLGCNQHDVFYLEISDRDGDAACQAWCDEYGVEYPTIGIDGGGKEISDLYNIHAWPILMLISPHSRNIVISDFYPETPQAVIDRLTQYPIDEYECGPAEEEDPTVEITIGNVTTTTVEATFTPNETCASYWTLLSTQADMEMWMEMMQMSLEQLVQMWGVEYTAGATYTWTEQFPDTEYMVYALPVDADGTAYELVTQTVTTDVLGGYGTSEIDIQATVTSDTSVYIVATPNVETAEYHYGLITKALYDEIGADSALAIIRGDNWPLYEVDEWEWQTLTPNTAYYAMASGINANGEWGTTTMVEFETTLTDAGMSEIDLQVTVNTETLSAVVEATPNDETVEYHYGVIEKEQCEIIGIDSTLAIIRGDGYPLSEPDESEWLELTPNIYYYAIASGMNANGEWGETTIEEFIITITSIESIDEIEYTMYPNPAKDYISISGSEIETVVVYNALGQEVGNYTVNGQELNISTESFEAGVYYMSVNGGRAARFVVIH